MTKKTQYETLSSPVKIAINQERPNTLEDWKRLRWDEASINGVHLSAVMKEKGIEPEKLTEAILRDFFSEVVLSQYTPENKVSVVNTLMKSFHQGGLMHPVSGGMKFVFLGEDFEPTNRSSKQVNIQTNANGFVIQEIYTVKQFGQKPGANKDLEASYPDLLIGPDPGNDHILKAQATLSVSFDNEASLQIEVMSQAISYGNETVKNIADQRNWLARLIDAIISFFGYNKVEDLSPDNSAPRP